MEGGHLVATLIQLAGKVVRIHLGLGKNQAVKVWGNVYETNHQLQLVPLPYHDVLLLSQNGGLWTGLLRHRLVFPHKLGGNLQNCRGHGGGKQQNAAVWVRLGKDVFNVLDKAHVKHLIGLIKDKILDFGKIEGSPL